MALGSTQGIAAFVVLEDKLRYYSSTTTGTASLLVDIRTDRDSWFRLLKPNPPVNTNYRPGTGHYRFTTAIGWTCLSTVSIPSNLLRQSENIFDLCICSNCNVTPRESHTNHRLKNAGIPENYTSTL